MPCSILLAHSSARRLFGNVSVRTPCPSRRIRTRHVTFPSFATCLLKEAMANSSLLDNYWTVRSKHSKKSQLYQQDIKIKAERNSFVRRQLVHPGRQNTL